MKEHRLILLSSYAISMAVSFNLAVAFEVPAKGSTLLTGKAAMGDSTKDALGMRRKITVQDLPPPSSNVLTINLPHVVQRPTDAWLQVLPGLRLTYMPTVSAIRAFYSPRPMATSSLRFTTPGTE